MTVARSQKSIGSYHALPRLLDYWESSMAFRSVKIVWTDIFLQGSYMLERQQSRGRGAEADESTSYPKLTLPRAYLNATVI